LAAFCDIGSQSILEFFACCQGLKGVKFVSALGMKDCLFCKIVSKSEPAEFVYEDELVVGFKSKFPNAPIHWLFVPREHIEDFHKASDEVVLRIKKVISGEVEKNGWTKDGYRIVVNGGTAKMVPHLHFHLLAKVSLDREV
jgi:histidine triad (HIT) family protein